MFPEGEEIERFRGLSARRIVRELGIPWWRLPALSRTMRRLVAERLDRVRLFPGVPAMLQRLSAAGVRIAIVSSNSQANVARVLGESAPLVDHWACGASAFGKGRMMRAVIRAAGVDRRQVLSVGDEVRDAEAAAKLGVDFVGVAWGYTHEAVLAALPGGRVCRSFDDLLAHVGVA